MAENIDELIQKLELLLLRQENFAKEIYDLREEIYRLKHNSKPLNEQKESVVIPPIPPKAREIEGDLVPPIHSSYQEKVQATSSQYFNSTRETLPKPKSDIEKIIGENLINKIGIAILIIGVAIGTKYSIDHELISPVTRMILGYLVGFGLLGVGLKLKKNYLNFSAVLVSGAIAIMYFITY